MLNYYNSFRFFVAKIIYKNIKSGYEKTEIKSCCSFLASFKKSWQEYRGDYKKMDVFFEEVHRKTEEHLKKNASFEDNANYDTTKTSEVVSETPDGYAGRIADAMNRYNNATIWWEKILACYDLGAD